MKLVSARPSHNMRTRAGVLPSDRVRMRPVRRDARPCGPAAALSARRDAPAHLSVGPARVVQASVLAAALLCFATPGHAAEGDHGHGHESWHAEFYSKLMRPDTKTPCCNLSDCRPTELRATGDHYEVKKDGRWVRVPPEKIVKVAPPDGGAHICAPPEISSWGPDDVYCVVMPFET